MDKTFKNDEQLRRKALREGQKTKQERNRSFYLNGIQAVAILGLGIAVAALAEIHTVIPVVATIGADGEVLKMRVIDQDNVSSEDALIKVRCMTLWVHVIRSIRNVNSNCPMHATCSSRRTLLGNMNN